MGVPGSRSSPLLAVRRWAADTLLAALLLLFGLAGTRFAAQNQPAATPLDLWADVLIAVAAVTMALRRRWPAATLAVVAAAITVYLLAGYPYGPIMVSYSVAVYTVAAHLPPRTAALVSAAGAVVMAAHVLVPAGGVPRWEDLFPAAAFVAVPFAVGVTVRASREAAQRARTDRARRIADDERLRIAQEVHDVVGHGLAAITMQAEIALHLLARKPEQAETALTAISRTSKAALDELRATLAVVRRGDDRAPAPGLAQVGALRDRLADAGLPVTLSVTGSPPRDHLPVAVDLAGYRVVQESLTNVLRHAGATTAAVRIEYRPDALVVEVTDTGRAAARDAGHGPGRDAGHGPGRDAGHGPGRDAGHAAPGTAAAVSRPDGPGAGAGSGIAGMRERVVALGGTLSAGHRPGGGFRVHAVLPLPDGDTT